MNFLRKSRKSSYFDKNTGLPQWVSISILLLFAFIIRLIYLHLTAAVTGDAVHYAWIAEDLAKGRFGNLDQYWANLFCYWQASLLFLGIDRISGAIISSFMPGIILVIIVAWLAKSLYGTRAGWYAGLFTAIHPRLVEYSCNGYSEVFYIFLMTCGIACLTRLIQRPSKVTALGWGISMGLYCAVRGEGLLLFLATLFLLIWVFARKSEYIDSGAHMPVKNRVRKPYISYIIYGVIGFLIVMGVYVNLLKFTMGETDLLSKKSALSLKFASTIDYRKSVQEIFSPQGVVFGKNKLTPSYISYIPKLILRYPKYFLYFVKKLPRVLMSPLFIFAILLPFFKTRQNGGLADKSPLLLMLIFPLFFYPFIMVDSRYIFATLIPIHIFGAAGLIKFCDYVSNKLNLRYLLQFCATAILLIMFPVLIWMGSLKEENYKYNRILAKYLAQAVPENEVIMGCPYGYITDTCFLAGRRSSPRLVTNDPNELVEFVRRKKTRWLILYEDFIRRANEQLLSVLDRGLPGFERVYEVKNRNGLRVQVFHIKD